MNRSLPFALLLGSLLVAGCAATNSAGAPKEKQQYRVIYVTGSNMPVRVPISPAETEAAASTAAPANTMTGEAFRDLVRRGDVTPNGGGR